MAIELAERPSSVTQTIRVGVYSRISHDPLNDKLGVGRHEREARRIAALHGWQVVEPVYEDDDITASGKKERPDFKRMLRDIRAGKLDAIVASEASRFDRSLDMRQFVDWYSTCHDAGILVAYGGAVANFANGEGLTELEIRAALSRDELRRITSRVRLKMEELRDENRPHGKAPFGYRPVEDEHKRRNREIVPEEKELIQTGVEALLRGATLSDVVWLFEDSGLHPRHRDTWQGDLRWRPRTLSGLLQNPALAGLTREGRKAIWPAIIEEDDHRQVVALFATRREPRRVRQPVSSLPGSVLRCGACGGSMALSGARKGGKRRYMCNNPLCGKRAVQQERAERVVGDAIVAALQEAKGIAPDTDRAEVEAEGKLITAKQRLEALEVQHALGEEDPEGISEGGYRLARQRLLEQQRKLRTDLDGLRSNHVLSDYADRLRRDGFSVADWEASPVENRRAMVANIFTRIEVGPGRKGARTDEDVLRRLTITWAI